MHLNSTGKKIIDIKVSKKKVLILFDDSTNLEIIHNTYLEFNLYKNKILSNADINKIKQRNDLETGYSYALNLLSKQSYSENKIRAKLQKKSVNLKDIDLIIDELKKNKMIDDDEYIKSIKEYNEQKNLGFYKLKSTLLNQGISEDKINDIEYNENNEINKAKKLMPSLIRKYQKYNYETQKKKVFENLIRNGFTSDVASIAIKDFPEIDQNHELKLLRDDFGTLYMKYSYRLLGNQLFQKIIDKLLTKGYKYKDIILIKGEYTNGNELD